MKLFKKKDKIEKDIFVEEELKKEMKKIPFFKRKKAKKRAKLLLEEYNKGRILQVNNDIDNKEYLKE